mgnify:CR=1 FL=1|tara:strand:- start:1459 stop:2619 length:1161 start_codon:yes stop_codon:yes gene_type:complete
MQFLWKYIDDLIGKGLETKVVFELLWYSSLTLIPIALPLAVLLASIMLVGGMAERSELTALNALGQPFLYIFKPLLIFAFFISIISFLVSNFAIPYSNLKATSLMYDIIKKKLNINIQEKTFFSEIEGYSIRVEKKNSDGSMSDVLIYDYSEKKGVSKVFTSEKAIMTTFENEMALSIELINGSSFSLEQNEKKSSSISDFKKYTLHLDLSSFEMERSNLERFSNRAKTMNINELRVGIDSLSIEIQRLQSKLLEVTKNNFEVDKYDRTKNSLGAYNNQLDVLTKKINKFFAEYHRKFTLALACIIMMIIGAPIGAIIKKGGFGLPVIFSILLFITYHVISITGEKMLKKDVLSPLIGMWSSSFIMIFIGIFLLFLVNKNVNIKRI